MVRTCLRLGKYMLLYNYVHHTAMQIQTNCYVGLGYRMYVQAETNV